MLDIVILAQVAAEAGEKSSESLTEALGPIVTILIALFAGWKHIRAANLQRQLHAAARGIKAYLDALPSESEREDVKETIKATAIAEGVNEELKREVRKATNTAIKIPSDPGAPPVLGRALSFALLVLAALGLALLPLLLLAGGCVAHEVPRAAERLAATAQVIHEAAAAHADLAALPPDEAAAALAGFQGLAAEHEAYARELVAAAGGDPARVRDLVAEWYEKAAARRRARLREAAERAAAVTETAVPR